MLKVLPIASGSTGNSMLVDIDGIRILIARCYGKDFAENTCRQ